MQTSANVLNKYQDRKRYAVFLHARYLMKFIEKTVECIVVNINIDGACIIFPPEAVFLKKEPIYLEIKPRELDIVAVTGNIVWHKKLETAFVAGVKFLKPLDTHSFEKLLF